MPYLIKSTRDEVFTVGIMYSKMLVSIIMFSMEHYYLYIWMIPWSCIQYILLRSCNIPLLVNLRFAQSRLYTGIYLFIFIVIAILANLWFYLS